MKLLPSPTRYLFFTGKGGVGKTSLSTATAIQLADAGARVLLVSTDAASNLDEMLNVPLRNVATPVPGVPGLSVLNIDPNVAAEDYRQRVLSQMAAHSTEAERATVREQLSGACTTEIASFDEQERALLLEDLQSPCTEEVAVFHAFSRTVSAARSAFVVLDTAPTGHSLLLMDATGAYHRQMTREYEGKSTAHLVTPLMRLQDASYTRIILVTLPETTPVSQAAALQEDLRRAHIEPHAWVVNKSILASHTRDPVLLARLQGERQQMTRIAGGLAQRTFVIPWTAKAPVGLDGLAQLLQP